MNPAYSERIDRDYRIMVSLACQGAGKDA